MSIVPYYSDRNNKIVYHDLTHQIVVVHNWQDNSFSLFNDRGLHYSRNNHTSKGEPEQTEIFCPNCGVDLLDFLAQGNRSSFRRRPSKSERSRSGSCRDDRSVALADLEIIDWPIRYSPPPSMGLSTAEFMHRDYFKLLGSINENGHALGAPGDDVGTSVPNDIFNQGYFKRFFRKIPPGVLGSGARAEVYKVVHVLKDIQLGVFAVKRINVGDHSQYLEHVLNEVLILYQLSTRGANEHNLIRYNHVWMETGDLADLNTIILDKEGAPSASENLVPYVYILQQYCDGGHLEYMMRSNFQKEISMLMKEKLNAERSRRRSLNFSQTSPKLSTTKLSENSDPESYPTSASWLLDIEIWKFFHDIANGVLYLHSHGILHRDLKPSNCLLESKYDSNSVPKTSRFRSFGELDKMLAQLPCVLVSDFGEGKFIEKQSLQVSMPFEERRGNTGTVEFTDPKLWVYAGYDRTKRRKRKFAHDFTCECDIYSLGMILCYLCVGQLPFAEVLSNTQDPDAVRRDISSWHESLTVQSFHDWFSALCNLVMDEFTQAMNDFEILAFMMIKGDGSLKPSADYVMEYLRSMKESRFLVCPSTESELPPKGPVTAIEHENLNVMNKKAKLERGADEEIDGGETVDLFNLPVNKQLIPQVYMDIDYRKYIFVGTCLACLALLETSNIHWTSMVPIAKLSNVLALVAGLQRPSSRTALLTTALFITAVVYN